MKNGFSIIAFLGLMILSGTSFSQVNSLEVSPEKEKMYSPYLLWKHQGAEGLADFKKNHPHEYLKELWYYAESFYIKRDYLKEGISMDPGMIPIDRFESSRKENEEAIVILPGFKDVLVLLPANKLIYKP